MNKYRKIILIFSLVLILGLGFFLRAKNHTVIPQPGESVDEYSFTWVGLSLLENGVPIGTSGLSPYNHLWKYINVNGFYQGPYTPNPFPIDQPWFDHPPLFGLVTGSYAYVRGVRDFADTTIAIIRKPMLAIGVVNLALLFLLAFLVFDFKTALVAGLIFATEPLIVISSRMAQAENLLITFFLGALLYFFLYQKKNKGVYFWLAITLAGLATLTKVSGWSVPVALILLTIVLDQKQKLQKSFLIFAGSLGLFLLFPIYGAIYDFNLFIQLLLANSSRVYFDGFNIVYSLLARQNITRDLQSGWITLGWISIIGLFANNIKQNKLWYIAAPLLSYLFFYMIFGSQSYGWYKFPFFPFLVLAISRVFIETLENPNLLFNVFLIFLPGGVMLNRIIPPEKFQDFVWQFRSFIVLTGSIFILPFISKKIMHKRIYQATLVVILLALVGLNIKTTLMMDINTWTHLLWIH